MPLTLRDRDELAVEAAHPAVNNWGGLGRWAFLLVTDPWDAEHLIRAKYLQPWLAEAPA